MRVAICWTHISGYMSACWHALAARNACDMRIVAFRSSGAGMNIAFSDELMAGLNARLLGPGEQGDVELLGSMIGEYDPDIVVIPGWAHAVHRALVRCPRLARARFVMTMDTPWRGTLRQRLGRYRIARLLKRIDRIVVAGERAWQLARVLGAPEEKIRRGLYGVDYDRLAPLHERRLANWPRKFLFVGRYESVKGIEVMLAAHRAYSASVAEPWPLTCCGSGPMNDAISRERHVTNLGFVQPAQQADVFASHGTFVLPSRYDPWPLALVEACAAGLPVIHTEACGSAVELVRSYFNGLAVPTGSVDALAGAMRWCHDHYGGLPEMGRRGQHLAAAYSAQAWATRWIAMFEELIPRH